MRTEQNVKRSLEQYLDKAASTYSAKDVDPFRYWTLRPSGFPYCGLRKLLNAARDLDTPRLHQLAGSYFMSVGTTTHEVFQEFTGLAGSMLGNWKCVYKKCGYVQKFCVYSRCPKCDSDVKYEELEILYKKTVIGHVDNLYRLDLKKGSKSEHAVVDFKTTSLKKINMTKSPFPYGGNVAQIEKYVPLLEDNYGVTINWWALIYLARDAPFRSGRKVIVHHLTDEEKERHLRILNRWVKVHRRVITAESAEDFDYVRARKFCRSEEDYNDRYRDEHNECEFRSKCFDDKMLDQTIETTRTKYKVFPLVNHVPEKVRQHMGL